MSFNYTHLCIKTGVSSPGWNCQCRGGHPGKAKWIAASTSKDFHQTQARTWLLRPHGKSSWRHLFLLCGTRLTLLSVTHCRAQVLCLCCVSLFFSPRWPPSRLLQFKSYQSGAIFPVSKLSAWILIKPPAGPFLLPTSRREAF